MSILDYTANDLLFAHWLKRMVGIQSENGGMWRGNRHPDPILLHRMIDDELDRLRPLRNPHTTHCVLYPPPLFSA